ncbi:MAG: ABC transporter ATP-binding protein [Pseudomonadota bacterium]|jgi:peptide/nickel transport system ATP-binding protein|nr:ATP-binding cassette domain-containing protein [Burkholderiales bacterium]MCA3253870.1 ATP-binding cassette domain-containing protein [Rubrivivax sp.]MCA3260031.1 ATP-binding cassette domain-containing protein [Rubrivivax sp.]MCZ8032847.1 ATP-binding cassette domain-containing protein [Rubrivivax sp.]
MNAFVSVEGLDKVFDVSPPWLNRVLHRTPRRLLRAIDGLSLEIERGQTVALVGESGCGKSTVARVLSGLYAPSRGRVLFDGLDVHAKRSPADEARFRPRVQMIFQDPYASLNPRWRVEDVVGEPLLLHGGVRSRVERRERVGDLLAAVGLSAADISKYPHQFSGGQRQRLSIARALAGHLEFLVCDEPTSALDVSVQAQVLNLMKSLQESRGLTYLFISHNLAAVRFISDVVGVMYLGRLVEMAPRSRLFAAPRHPYTRMLLDAVPSLHPQAPDQTVIQGDVPNPLEPPRGCTFHPRCPHAVDRCREQAPTLLEAGGIRVACHAVEEGRLG